jgi:hypothetical protein
MSPATETTMADDQPATAMDVLRTAPEPLTAREIAEAVLVAAEVDNPKMAAVADLTGSILASRGITRARASNGPIRVARPAGDWLLKTEFNSVGGLQTYIMNCAGPPPAHSK